MRLFDETERTSTHPAINAESDFAFLNRINNPWFAEVRQALEAWFAELPSESQGDVRSRFRSKDGNASAAAFWELFLHALFLRLGWTLAPHPSMPGTDNKPDYLLQKGNFTFYLEATAPGAGEAEAAVSSRIATIVDNLNRMISPEFRLGMQLRETGDASPSLKGLRRRLTSWMGQHDPASVLQAFEQDGRLPTMLWKEDGWVAEFSLVPIQHPRVTTPTDRAIGYFAPPGGFIDDVTPLQRAMRAKAAKYGDMDRPYVLGVLSHRAFADTEDIEQALFGRVVGVVSVGPDGQLGQLRWERQRNGLWMGPDGPRSTRVSATLTARRLKPAAVTQAELTLWRNPWAARPLSTELPFAVVDLEPETGRFTTYPPTAPLHLTLGLPADWPGAYDPWGYP